MQLWIIQIEEDEPTGFIVYEKVRPGPCQSPQQLSLCPVSSKTVSACLQFEALVLRLMTEEATSHKRNTEDEILAAFEVESLVLRLS